MRTQHRHVARDGPLHPAPLGLRRRRSRTSPRRGPPSARPTYDEVIAIQDRLNGVDSEFTYDETVPAARRLLHAARLPDANTQTGFCQQFASAMAVMLRIARHPGPGGRRVHRRDLRRRIRQRSASRPTTPTPGSRCCSPTTAGSRSNPRRTGQNPLAYAVHRPQRLGVHAGLDGDARCGRASGARSRERPGHPSGLPRSPPRAGARREVLPKRARLPRSAHRRPEPARRSPSGRRHSWRCCWGWHSCSRWPSRCVRAWRRRRADAPGSDEPRGAHPGALRRVHGARRGPGSPRSPGETLEEYRARILPPAGRSGR